MDIRQLRYLVEIVEQGSFTAAAAALQVAQPALSAQIKQLEEELSLRLLVRHSRGADPTPEGRELYDQALELLKHYEQILIRMDELAQARPGKVVVGVTPSIRNLLGASIIRQAAAADPPVQVTLVEGLSSMLAEWLVAKRLDVAILYDPPQNLRGLRSEFLTIEQLHAVRAAAGAGEGDSIAFTELCRLPLVMPALKNEVLNKILVETAEERGLKLNIAIEVQSMSVLRDLVLSGDYATAVPYGSLLEEIKGGQLKAVRIVDPEIPRRMCFAFPDQRNLTRPELVIQRIVRKAARDLVSKQPEIWAAA